MARRQSERNYRSLFEDSLDGILITERVASPAKLVAEEFYYERIVGD